MREVVIQTPPAEHLDLENSLTFQRNQEGKLVFPDEEAYFRLEVSDVEKAYLIHTGSPKPNRGLFWLFCALEKLQKEGISSEVIFTYFPYGMQDEKFEEGELNLAKLLLQSLANYEVEKIHALTPHFSHHEWTDQYPFDRINGMDLVLDKIDLDNFILIGPDLGSQERFEVPGFEKERESSYQVEIRGEVEEEVEGRNVLVFDDLIETGGTMVEAWERLKEMDASQIQAAAIHGVLEKGIKRVGEKYDKLWLTNSIQNDHFNVKIEPLLEKIVKK